MHGPPRNDRKVITGTPLERYLKLLGGRIDSVRDELRTYKAAQRSPTQPLYDPTLPSDAIDGQLTLSVERPPKIDHNRRPAYYSEGHWHPFDLGSGGFTTFEDFVMSEPTVFEYWPAFETSGDLVGLIGGRLLVPHGGVTYGLPGPFDDIPADTAVHLNGANAYFDYTFVGSEGDLFAGPFTVILWVYQDAPAVAALFSAYSGVPVVGNNASIYTFTGNDLRLVRASSDASSGVALTTGGFHVLALTYNGNGSTNGGNGVARLFLDGTQIGTLTNANANSAQSFRLGVQGSPVGNFFNGRICQVALFGSDLSGDVSAISVLTNGPNATAGQVPTADGAGGYTWAAPTIEVEF